MIDKPSKEDFDAHARVEAWWRQVGHDMELRQGRFETIFSSDEGMVLRTRYGDEHVDLADVDRLRQFGFTIIVDEDGDMIGVQHAAG